MSPSGARRHLGVLLRYDLKYGLTSPRGLLFVVFYALVWSWILWKLAKGAAEVVRNPEASLFLSYFLDEGLMRLFRERAPTLAGYFVVAITLTPIFAMLGGCDQTATDLGTKHLRFLIPRVGRQEIYLARFLGALVLVCGAQIAVGAVATGITLFVDRGEPGHVLLFGAQAILLVTAYSIPFVAFMAFMTASMASAGVAALVGIGGYGLFIILVYMLKGQWSGAEIFGYLMPSGLKPSILQPDLGRAILALLGVIPYTLAFFALGWQVFKTRDA